MLRHATRVIHASLMLASLACGGSSRAPVAVEEAQAAIERPAPHDLRILLDLIEVESGSSVVSVPPPSANRARGHSVESLSEAVRIADVVDCQRGESASAPIVGELSLQLEIDDRGRVLGGSTDPVGGQDGVAYLASCLLERSRQWTFPSRDTPGHTVLVIPFRFE